MRIGNTEIKNGLCLSPMAGFTDLPMRRQCRRFGAEYTVTEMVSAAALCYGDLKTADLAYLTEDNAPCAIQLFGHDPEQMARAVTMMASGEYAGSRSHVPPAAMDLNMGCPVKKIVSGGDGSALMRSPDSVWELTYAAVRAAYKYDIPVTVKIRAGWDSDHKNEVEIARTAVSAGAAAVCVHGRTREQMYRPGVDLDVIAAVRDALPAHIPVVGNGDVCDAASYRNMIAKTGCDGVAVGRAALGNPWVFAEIRADLAGESFTPPTEADRRREAMILARDIVGEHGDSAAARECRGRVAHFLTGVRGAAAMRGRIHRAESLSEIEEILAQSLGE
ncbi:MAG: tRNA-dihydrouridine synthase [Clostridia bacterium]|nr:tRNA-dihydrouridine synthase [Clostridia bacterium]